MKFSNIIVLCLSLTVLCTQLESQSTFDLIKVKMLNSYQEAVRYGRECAKRVCKLFEDGKNMLSTKLTDMTSKIKKGRENIATPTDVADGDSMSASNELTPEEVDRLIEEIKKKFAEYVGNDEGMKGEKDRDGENKEDESNENEGKRKGTNEEL